MKAALLITGAGGVIGRALALRLAREEDWKQERWILTARDAAKLQPLVQALASLGIDAQGISLDMADKAGCEAFLKALPGLGPFKGLALLAGINHDDPLPRLSEAAWDRVYQVNVGCHAGLLRSLDAGGLFSPDARGLLAGSQVGLRGAPGQAAYGAAKGALLDLLLRSPPGLRLNLLLPPLVPSPLLDNLSLEALQNLFAQRLLADPDPAQSCAEAAAYLLSDASQYVHRQVWHADSRVSVLGWPV